MDKVSFFIRNWPRIKALLEILLVNQALMPGERKSVNALLAGIDEDVNNNGIPDRLEIQAEVAAVAVKAEPLIDNRTNEANATVAAAIETANKASAHITAPPPVEIPPGYVWELTAENLWRVVPATQPKAEG